MPFRKTLSLVFLLVSLAAANQDGFRCLAGLRAQKTYELYWENGLDASCTHGSVLGGHLSLGLSAVSSRLGTALGTNALKQEEYLASILWNFRVRQRLQPYAGLGLGYFWLDVEDPLFEFLPHSSPLLAVQGGLTFAPSGPLAWRLGFGYHLIVGDGLSGPGSLYPLFVQTALLWRLPL